MSTPSPPSQPSNSNADPPQKPPPTVIALSAAAASAARKPHPVLWSHEETLLLIEAYKSKAHSLTRGQLRAHHWEEVAETVSGRYGHGRSATQCRHKIEKLRKRYRIEKQRHKGATTWPYYRAFDDFDNGMFAAIMPQPLSRFHPGDDREDDDAADDVDDRDVDDAADDDDDDEGEIRDNVDDDDDDEDERHSKSRSINYILRRPSLVSRFAGNASACGGGGDDVGAADDFTEFAPAKKRRIEWEGEREARERRAGLELAGEIRGFAERMMAMERRRMEMVRETEKRRMETEKTKIQMIQKSQTEVVDLIARVFGTLPENVEQKA